MTEKNYAFHVPVYFEDIDYGGIVYHANYIKYMERARTAWVKELGSNLHELAQQQIYFVVKNINIDYLYPARMYDELNVLTHLVKMGRSSLTLQQDICFAAAQDKFLTKAQVILVCVDH